MPIGDQSIAFRVIDRNQTGHPTIGARNRALFLGGAHLCLAIHERVAPCPKNLDFVRRAFQQDIPTYLIEEARQEAMKGTVEDRRKLAHRPPGMPNRCQKQASD